MTYVANLRNKEEEEEKSSFYSQIQPPFQPKCIQATICFAVCLNALIGVYPQWTRSHP